MLSQENNWRTSAPSGLPVFLQGSPVYKVCAGEAPHAAGCFLTWRLPWPAGSGGESRWDVNDSAVTTLPPRLLGRTAACAHYEEEPCREPMTTGEFSGL